MLLYCLVWSAVLLHVLAWPTVNRGLPQYTGLPLSCTFAALEAVQRMVIPVQQRAIVQCIPADISSQELSLLDERIFGAAEAWYSRIVLICREDIRQKWLSWAAAESKAGAGAGAAAAATTAGDGPATAAVERRASLYTGTEQLQLVLSMLSCMKCMQPLQGFVLPHHMAHFTLHIADFTARALADSNSNAAFCSWPGAGKAAAAAMAALEAVTAGKQTAVLLHRACLCCW